jgi:hypothetical protein
MKLFYCFKLLKFSLSLAGRRKKHENHLLNSNSVVCDNTQRKKLRELGMKENNKLTSDVSRENS